ncbi:MAG TPA: hypothetical protein VLH39_03710 [Magnetospirillaceae bacterium]|nr:hypothetical protein [Magnetospirillaceae bacterium]
MGKTSRTEPVARLQRSPAERALMAVIGALTAVLVLGTAWALATDTRGRASRAGTHSQAALEGEAVYTRLGTLRASTQDDPPAVVAVTIAFPYPDDDRAFREEPDDKASRLRETGTAFFAEKRADELHPAFEGTLKAGLRDRLNAQLSLGRIREIWFSDFAVVR